jgi:uridine kinase
VVATASDGELALEAVRRFKPDMLVVVEGLLGFSTPVMRQFYDVMVYLDPPEELRKVWKIKRDTSKRGYTVEQVQKELGRREPDSRDFIRPQRQYADIVTQFYTPLGITPEQAGAKLSSTCPRCARCRPINYFSSNPCSRNTSRSSMRNG